MAVVLSDTHIIYIFARKKEFVPATVYRCKVGVVHSVVSIYVAMKYMYM